MRITSGLLRGRKIFSPPVRNLRLTEEKIRKAIFDTLGDVVKDARVLELFAGSGALGIEAFSRGAREVVFVDHDLNCLQTIKRNLGPELEKRSLIISSDSLEAIAYLEKLEQRFDLVILDPPYKKDLAVLILQKICECDILKSYALIVVEHYCDEKIEEAFFSGLELLKQKKYGQTEVSFFLHNMLSY
jgi:16S rRNA (guanine966-N2)-methyltransferase